MDLRLQSLAEPPGGRPTYSRPKGSLAATGLPGEVRLLCGACSALVALNPPMGALMSVVFRCPECGAESEIPRAVKAGRGLSSR